MLLITKMNHISYTEGMSPETHKVLLDFLPFSDGSEFHGNLEGTPDIWVKVIWDSHDLLADTPGLLSNFCFCDLAKVLFADPCFLFNKVMG